MPYEEKAVLKQHNPKSPARKQINPVVEPPVTQASQEQVQRARIDPARLTPADVMALQRTIGNQAVVELLGRRKTPGPSTTPAVQAKLKVGPVGDRYEQEADHVANQVVGQIDAAPDSSTQRQGEEELQEKPVDDVQRQEDEEEEDLAMKPADDVQRQEEEEDIALKPADEVQRQEEEEEDDLAMKPATGLQRLDAGGMPQVDAETERGIKAARGSGSPIADKVRAPMEQGFGADFGSVRVHTDARADTLNRSLKAKAFTTGNDVFFQRGAYQPGNSEGKRLLAHELTHTIQQMGTKPNKAQTKRITVSTKKRRRE